MIIDTCIFNNENDIFMQRYHALTNVVDKFVVVEFSHTFSGIKKEQKFDISCCANIDNSKIIYRYLESPIPLNAATKECVGKTKTNVSLHWKHQGKKPSDLNETVRREISQRDMIYDVLIEFAKDTDIILVSDVDEIPNPEKISEYASANFDKTLYFEMDWRLFFSNFQCELPWYGAFITSFRELKKFSPDTLRLGGSRFVFDKSLIITDGGTHLSYLGGKEKIRKKLRDLAYQGVRAEVTKFLINKVEVVIDIMLYFGWDMFFQGRRFKLIKPDENNIFYIEKNFLLQHTKK